MIKIIFVCLGNICRSPMAECVMMDILKKRGLDDKVSVISRATSYEEEGNDIYPPARRKLVQMGVPVLYHRATRLCKQEADSADYIIGMEKRNIDAMHRIIGSENMNKVSRLLDFCENPHDIADPWWSGNFDITYDEIVLGCENLLTDILKECDL